DKPAAAVVETVLGEGAIRVRSRRWLRELDRQAKRAGMLVMMEETIVRCARKGRIFRFEASGVRADMREPSRSKTVCRLPMSLLLCRPDMPTPRDYTESAGERAGVALLTAEHVLEAYWADDSFAVHVRRKERLVRDWLENLVQAYAHLGLGVRGRGLIQGLVTPPRSGVATAVASTALAAGLVTLTTGSQDEVLKIQPALTID